MPFENICENPQLLGCAFVMVGGVHLTLGLCLGWWFRKNDPRKSAGGDGFDAATASQILTRLNQLTSGVAADVGAHAARLNDVNQAIASLSLDSGVRADDMAKSLALLLTANTQIQEKLASAEQKLQEHSRQLGSYLAEARTDALTGLANRRAFFERLELRFQERKRRPTALSVILIDIDEFKKFNDEYGHPAGDTLLRGVAGILAAQLREMDLVARYGGDEFAVILTATSLDHAARHAERVRAALAACEFRVNDTHLGVTVSLGVAEAVPEDDADSLLKRADMALYAAKAAGRNLAFSHTNFGIQPVPRSRAVRSPEVYVS